MCGVHFQLFENGYLYLSDASLKLKEDFSQKAVYLHEGAFIPYQTVFELISLMDLIGSKENVQASVMCEITAPAITVPLPELAARVRHSDTVQLIQNTDFLSYFQPIVSLSNLSLYGYESLLRDPLGRISPGQLFETASLTGMQGLLDQKAREVAIKGRKGQIEDGLKSFINFLPSTIYNPEFCLRHTFQIVEASGVKSEDLVFEVVETEKISDMDHLKNIFKTYKQEGMKVALDDFGAGYSTTEVLLELLPDFVKIDRGKIMDCDRDLEKQLFLKSVVEVSQALNIITLAEGIERKEELEFCRDIGITLAQGYYLGKPESRPAYILPQSAIPGL
ncbi:EAL domain-containing protein [Peribacillus saganii]|uniref:EAL domain-containing protein n=2 Tax=Peribacillus saganii TaxID=2303992 RepID=A0A372LTQ9_9BACI|nr:EAL domain-containing protein [Peribacillus saganii]